MYKRMPDESAEGYYHVIIRGYRRQRVFRQMEDYREYLRMLEDVKQKFNFLVYAYCLMETHVHLLLKVQGDRLPEIVEYISCRYKGWFHKKHKINGSLFQENYQSVRVEEKYLPAVFSYIHSNPCKAGLAKQPQDYRYSSSREYAKKCQRMRTGKGADSLPKSRTEAEARILMEERLGNKSIAMFCELDVEIQSEYVAYFVFEKISYAQIARITGMPYERIRYLGTRS